MKYLNCTLGCLGWLLVATAPATASVPVSCAPGLPPVQSQGIQIVNGVIELLDNACYTPCEPCTSIPPALAFSNMAVTPSSAEPGDIVTYTANVANLIVAPVPGVTYDTCTLELRQPNSTLASSTEIPSLASSISRPVTIPATAVNGAWTIRPVCRRFVASQEIVVAAIPAVTVQVTSTEEPPPAGCDAMTPPLRAGIVTQFNGTYPSFGYGVEFGVPFSEWRYHSASNTYSGGEFQWANVRVFQFTAPSIPTSGRLNMPSSQAGLTISLSSQCGNFVVPAGCLGHGQSGTLRWTTAGVAGDCQLTPGQTYFFNAAWIDYSSFVNNGTVVPASCVCPGPSCSQNTTASCLWRTNMSISTQ